MIGPVTSVPRRSVPAPEAASQAVRLARTRLPSRHRRYHGGVGNSQKHVVSTADAHTSSRGPLLVQATVPPLDEDGVMVSIIGTVLFAVASLVCWIRLDALTEAGYRDWLWICVSATVLGLCGMVYAIRRRGRTSATRDH